MTSEHLVQLMIEERDRLQAAIDALQAGSTSKGTKTTSTQARRKPGRPAKAVSEATAPTVHVIDPLPGLVRKPAKWSAAKRKAQGEKMRMYWAGKSKGGKVPF